MTYCTTSRTTFATHRVLVIAVLSIRRIGRQASHGQGMSERGTCSEGPRFCRRHGRATEHNTNWRPVRGSSTTLRGGLHLVVRRAWQAGLLASSVASASRHLDSCLAHLRPSLRPSFMESGALICVNCDRVHEGPHICKSLMTINLDRPIRDRNTCAVPMHSTRAPATHHHVSSRVSDPTFQAVG